MITFEQGHVYYGDCIEVMRGMPDNSVDSIVTDPPYGLGFMGKEWDALPPGLDFAIEALRVLKPGGHLLAFGGTRTWHRLAVAVEDAGFEIRDSIAWLYGSGFPKSRSVDKDIDRLSGAIRERRPLTSGGMSSGTANGWNSGDNPHSETAPLAGTIADSEPITEAARQWRGWGTALKPAFEPIVVGRKPIAGTVAANVLTYGTGALNIDASRIGEGPTDPGRFPANIIFDDAQAEALNRQTNEETSRFFYVAKAPKKERPVVDGVAHPTVKPLALMRYLVTLVTPPGGTVLDPFAGSGTTIEAALLEGFKVLGVENEETYFPLIQARIDRAGLLVS